MFFVVNNHRNDLYVLSDKTVGPEKKIENDKPRAGPTSIPAKVINNQSFG